MTGGGKGIGKGIAHRLAEAGAQVVITDLDAAAAEATAQEVVSNGQTAIAIMADVSDEQDVQRLVEACNDKFSSIDILVNNAGIYPPMPVMQMTAAESSTSRL